MLSLIMRKNEVRFTKLRKTDEISIAFSEKLSRRRRIINLDLYFEGNYCFTDKSLTGSRIHFHGFSFRIPFRRNLHAEWLRSRERARDMSAIERQPEQSAHEAVSLQYSELICASQLPEE